MISPTSILHRTVRTTDPASLLVDLDDLLQGESQQCTSALLARVGRLSRDPSAAALRELLGLEVIAARGAVRNRVVRALTNRADEDLGWAASLTDWTVTHVYRIDEPSGEQVVFVCHAASGPSQLSVILSVDGFTGEVSSRLAEGAVELAGSAVTPIEPGEAGDYFPQSALSPWLRRLLPAPPHQIPSDAVVLEEYGEFIRSEYGRGLGGDVEAGNFVNDVISYWVRRTGYAQRGCCPRQVNRLLRQKWKPQETSLSLLLHQSKGLRAYLSWLFSCNRAPVQLILQTFAAVDQQTWRIQSAYTELSYDDHAEVDIVRGINRVPHYRGLSFDDWDDDDDVAGSDKTMSPLAGLELRAGGSKELQSLDVQPLGDETLAVELLPADIVARVQVWSGHMDRFLDSRPGSTEFRTACRRFLADVATIDPGIFRRLSQDGRGAAGMILAVYRINGMDFYDDVLVDFFGLRSPVASRACGFLRVLELHGEPWDLPKSHARYLVSASRLRLAEDYARLQEGPVTVAQEKPVFSPAPARWRRG